MNRLSCLLLASICQLPVVAAMAAPGTDANFQSELKSLLERGQESKRGVVFHLNGETLAGVVKQILSDAVLVSNREHASILIRLDRIDAVELD